MEMKKNRKLKSIFLSFGSCLVLLLFLLLAAPARLQAQEHVQQYLEIAAEQNPELKARFNEYQAALERSTQARGLPDPELSFSLFLMPMERYMGEQVGGVSFMQMFPWFGSLKAGEEEASYMAKMSFQRFVEAKIELFFNVKSLWYDLYEKEQELALLQEEMELLQSLERLALSTYSSGQGKGATSRPMAPSRGNARQEGSGSSPASGMSGMNMGRAPAASGSKRQGGGGTSAMGGMQGQSGGMVDVLLVQLQMKELENRIRLLEKSQKPLRTAFNKMLNRQADAEVLVSDTLMPAAPPAALSMVPEELIANHPMIKMYEWDEQAREAQARMAKLMGRPMIGLGLNYMLFRPRELSANEMGPMDNGRNMLMPMATLTLPIYRKKNNAQKREAQFLQDAAVNQREAAINQLLTELEELLYDYEASVSNLELIEEQLIFTAQAIRLLTTSYAVGNVGMETLIQQRQNLLRYKEQQLREITAQHKTVAAINRLMSIDI
jgi:outer membrane protein TolC